MKKTLGARIAELRKAKEMTQEEISEKLGVSPQAVSKWENDVSCPDIMILPVLAKILGVSSDELLTGEREEEKRETLYIKESERRNFDDLVLRVYVNSIEGDKVKVNLPFPLLKAFAEAGAPVVSAGGKSVLNDINWDQVITLIEGGVVGDLVEVESADGDTVRVVIE